MLAKIKQFIKSHQDDIILVIGVILISLFSFAMGYIVAKQQEKEPIQFEITNDKFLISNKNPNVKCQMSKISHWAFKNLTFY